MSHNEDFPTFKTILSGVPQGSNLRQLRFPLYTDGILTTNRKVLGTFADNTVIMTKEASQPKAIGKDRNAAPPRCTKGLGTGKYRLNSVHGHLAMLQKDSNIFITPEGSQAKSAKFLENPSQ